ncbi:50S ribosomal protein L13 [Acholeplasma equirhinis]|uniref:50S ribosomal protein L13 n=1 Tax=Acholeplasma equirhinis TaxID=555393 RepID=UPI00197AADFC|nr:50S ribosomal protein L13 [Acholeplasma equirhinis]MBN3490908.1 50S ribosomal protein L13 [Acholeplasma equirhinis]
MKTFMANEGNITRKWYVVDAEGKTLGRLATVVASVLRGKHKPTYTPHVDAGDYVIIINADKIKLTGNKWNDKFYYSHSGYNGGLSKIAAKDLMDKKPTAIVEKAIKGMVPRNRLGADVLRKLFVYAGPEHKHQAQQPESLEV